MVSSFVSIVRSCEVWEPFLPRLELGNQESVTNYFTWKADIFDRDDIFNESSDCRCTDALPNIVTKPTVSVLCIWGVLFWRMANKGKCSMPPWYEEWLGLKGIIYGYTNRTNITCASIVR